MKRFRDRSVIKVILGSFITIYASIQFANWIQIEREKEWDFGILEETCAVFSVYGGKERYEAEVSKSISRLKINNPDVTIFLVSDNASLKTQHVDYFEQVPSSSEFGPWFLRTEALQKITRRCLATIAMDSHVTSCSTNLRSRMLELVSPQNFVVGTNIVHDLSPNWRASPLIYANVTVKKFPHNCIVLLKRGTETQKLLNSWLHQIKIGHKDDQKALYKALLATSIFHTSLPERFIVALKSIDRIRFGFWPRFTYAIDRGYVDLLHSYHTKAVASEFDEDVCRLLNRNFDARYRVIYQQSDNSVYENIPNKTSCNLSVGKYEPELCEELFHF